MKICDICDICDICGPDFRHRAAAEGLAGTMIKARAGFPGDTAPAVSPMCLPLCGRGRPGAQSAPEY